MARPGNKSGIPRDEQGLVRVSKDTLSVLQRIANKEGLAMIDLAEAVFKNFISVYSQHDDSVLNRTNIMPLIFQEEAPGAKPKRKR